MFDLMFKLIQVVFIGGFFVLDLVSIVFDLLSKLEIFLFLDFKLLVELLDSGQFVEKDRVCFFEVLYFLNVALETIVEDLDLVLIDKKLVF